MNKMNFAYSGDTISDGLVEQIVTLSHESITGHKDAKYAEDNKNACIALIKFAAQGTLFADKVSADTAIAKEPMVRKACSQRFNYIISQVVSALLPEGSAEDMIRDFAEYHQVGYGDTAVFRVDSNELFVVSDLAEGIRRGGLQKVYNDEFTVNPEPVHIGAFVDWYKLVCGMEDLGDFGARITRSFENYIYIKVVAQVASAVAGLPTGYTATFSTLNWANLAQIVSAANSGVRPIALGTVPALAKVLPETIGLQYGLGQDWIKEGHLNRYVGVDLLPLMNVINPSTVNSNPTLILPDSTIYMISAPLTKPVKIVFEGQTVNVEEDPSTTPDKSYNMDISFRMGVKIVLGAKFGAITGLNA
jgi:hypothetical protein